MSELPQGFGVELDADAKELEPGVWFGGSPARIMRLTSSGRAAFEQLRTGPVASRAAGLLARRLTDAGLAHPRPPKPATADVTVVIPVYGRVDSLDRCLGALEADGSVIVVDGASPDGDAVAEVAHRHGAKVVRRDVNGGPGAARDSGLEHVHAEFVAFLDSDCIPPPGWVTQLVAHLGDPLVAAVAPRITAVAPDTWAGRYTRANGSLDLGARPARVAPGTRVAYVPTAALVARRAALLEVARAGRVFDPELRIGEDVDLIWRLSAAGWRVRYDPAVEVAHREPDTWSALLARRFRYGTSAAPLAQRHGAAVAPLVLHPWPALTVAAVLNRRPIIASLGLAGSVLSLTQTLRRAQVPTREVLRAVPSAANQTWLGVGRYGIQLAAPVLATAAATGRPGRRIVAASLLLGPPLDAWRTRCRTLDPVRFTLGWLADSMSYGAGVWTGALARRTSVPLRPILARTMQRSRVAASDKKVS